MVTNGTQPQVEEVDAETWMSGFLTDWHQGEHVCIIGPTGTGKTTIAHTILDARDYVCVLAVKRSDDTLDRFRKGNDYGRARYKIIKKWPPVYTAHKVILWIKPASLTTADLRKQAVAIHAALSSMYVAGGWCIYFDEAGYIAGELGLGHQLGILLNQGRSSHITVVATMTRPTSMIARVPKESLNQARHRLIFRYENEDEIKACARVADMPWKKLQELMSLLRTDPGKGYSDFLYIGKGKVLIVRNTKR